VNYVKSNQSRQLCRPMYSAEHVPSPTAASDKASSQHRHCHDDEIISGKRVESLGKIADCVVPCESNKVLLNPFSMS
jgi:hypothetical protein